MGHIKLTVAYDGTNYHGWQLQPGKATVEGELNKAISQLVGEQVCVTGASRTDAHLAMWQYLILLHAYQRRSFHMHLTRGFLLI